MADERRLSPRPPVPPPETGSGAPPETGSGAPPETGSGAPPETGSGDPPPMRTNDVLVAAVGTAVWGAALVVLLLIGLPDRDRWWLWVCVTGIGIGLFGMWYIPRIQRGRDALIARNEARRAAQQPED